MSQLEKFLSQADRQERNAEKSGMRIKAMVGVGLRK